MLLSQSGTVNHPVLQIRKSRDRSLSLSICLLPSFLYSPRCNPLPSSVSLIETSFILSLHSPHALYDLFPAFPSNLVSNHFYFILSHPSFIHKNSPYWVVLVLPNHESQFPSSFHSFYKTQINAFSLWIPFSDLCPKPSIRPSFLVLHLFSFIGFVCG